MDAITRSLCKGTNIAHLATLMADGAPHAAPVWIDVTGDRLLICKEQKSLAYRNIQRDPRSAIRDPRVAISIIAADSPYRGAYIRAEVVEVSEEPDAGRLLDNLSIKYTGVPYPDPAPFPMVALHIEPSRARGRDFSNLHAEPGT